MNSLDLDTARAVLRLDENTGKLYWRTTVNPRAPAGSEAGWHSHGYKQITLGGRKFFAHRIVWLLYHGVWPDHQIDHINRDRSDNRPSNLRACSHSQNQANCAVRRHNKVGLKGVRRNGKRFDALICAGGKQRYLGSFKTAEAAHDAYWRAAKQLHGPFASAG